MAETTTPSALRCPYCGGEIEVETETTGGYYSETIVTGIECQTYQCGATWQRDGVALFPPRKMCEVCGSSQRPTGDRVPPHSKAWGGHCPGDPAPH